MCADNTTYSSFNAGSLPGNFATTLADSIGFVSIAALACIEPASGNRGSVLRSLASAAISANVCPEPAKNFSALAGFTVSDNFNPSVSLNFGSASTMLGRVLFAVMRDHGISIEAGFGMLIMPATPAARYTFHRSAIDW